MMSDDVKFYTAKGDDGTTGCSAGARQEVPPRPAACGDVDEARAALGVARAAMLDPEAAAVVLQAQRDLYHLMVNSPPRRTPRTASALITRRGSSGWAADRRLRRAHDLPREFTVSGDSTAGAALGVARTVVRRAERTVVRLYDEGYIENPHLLAYLNRLSSLLLRARATRTRSGAERGSAGARG